jgi:hypothetical protein
MAKIKVAYLELCSLHEDYSCYPRQYSGCSIFASWAKEMYNSDLGENEIDFYIFAPECCFGNAQVQNEKIENCMFISVNDFNKIKSGQNLKSIMPNKFDDFDIIMHHNSNLYIDLEGLKAKQIVWGPFGTVSEVTEKADHVFYWRKHQKPQNDGQNIYKVQLGKPVAQNYVSPEKKSDFIFQCTRHDRQTNTIEVIEQCKANKIEFIFGGPVMQDQEIGCILPGIEDVKWYPCLLGVEGGVPNKKGETDKNIKYMGNQIPEKEKLSLSQEARLNSFLFKRNPAFNLSVIESLSVGTPILVPKELLPERTASDIMPEHTEIIEDDQFFREVVIEGETGFFYDGDNFKDCYDAALDIDPQKCWEMARNYSLDKMLDSFSEGIKQVMDT